MFACENKHIANIAMLSLIGKCYMAPTAVRLVPIYASIGRYQILPNSSECLTDSATQF